jgi:hypothetical protein
MRPLHLVKDDNKPDSDISVHWTRRLEPTDPAMNPTWKMCLASASLANQ